MSDKPTPSQPTPQGQGDAPSSSEKWFERGLLIAAVLACAVAISPSPADPDLWGHVQYGREVLSSGVVPATTTHSYTANGYRWINHENLSELVFAIGADSVGPIGMLIIKCLLGVGAVCLMMRCAIRNGVGLITACLIGLLVSVNLAFHWSVRPQLFSFIHFTLLVALLSYCFKGWEGRWRLPLLHRGDKAELTDLGYSSRRMRLLWLAPVIFLFWANSHGGFVAGLCIYIAYLVCRSIEAVSCRGREGFGLVRRFALMALVGLLATLINPYGPRLHFWLIESLGTPRPEISEWWAPDLFAPLSLPLWLIVITFSLSLAFTRRSRDFTHLVLLGITLWQSLSHQRHIPFFTILFGFWMPIHLESLLRRFLVAHPDAASRGGEMSRPMRWAVAMVLCAAYGLLGYKLYDRVCDMPVDREHYPVAAIQYMADHDLRGKLVVTYNWAQYAITALGADSPDKPGAQVSFDGRFRTCYPQEIVDMHFDFFLGDYGTSGRYRSPNSTPGDGSLVLEYGQPALVLISRGQPQSTNVMQEHCDQWALLYQDKHAQVWGRGSIYADPNRPDFIPPGERSITDEPQIGTVTWPALPVWGRLKNRLATESEAENNNRSADQTDS